MANEAFFGRVGDEFIPTDVARGPWNRESLHGRVIAGLLGYAIERDHGDPDFQAARLTVDMFRLPPWAPVSVTTEAIRSGGRIRVVDATFICEGEAMAKARAVLLRRAEQPAGSVWTPPAWDVPAPDAITPPEMPQGYNNPWDSRPISGGFGSTGQKRAWVRENRPLIEGVPLTPFLRAASCADFANPLANSGDQGLQFINADLTLYLHRDPAGEWLGFEVTGHHSNAGVAMGDCLLYDEQGVIGRSTVAALAQRRR